MASSTVGTLLALLPLMAGQSIVVTATSESPIRDVCRIRPLAGPSQLNTYLHDVRRSRELRLTTAEYLKAQSLYLSWLDRRILAGDTVENMAHELKRADLLGDNAGLSVPEELNRTLAGYATAPKVVNISGARDIIALSFGLWTGAACALDETVVLYDRRTHEQIAYLNAEVSSHGYYLSSLDAGARDASGLRVVASSWIVSNCTSDWNGARVRIDLLRHKNLKQILAYQPRARNSDGIQAIVSGKTVRFRYTLGNNDLAVSDSPETASYIITDSEALRQAPLAATRLGFITEWLNVSDEEAAQFSDPKAAKEHHEVRANLVGKSLEWKSASMCGSIPEILKLTAQLYGTNTLQTFVLAGAVSTDLRMVATADEPKYQGCRVVGPAELRALITERLPPAPDKRAPVGIR